ncbi:hypothetical protein D3C75_1124600 [compost metagenome]
MRGISATQEVLLKEEAAIHITDLVDRLQIPTYFVMGKYDYMTSTSAAKDYYDTLEAPVKEFVLFEESAHYPQFEEKERFDEWLNSTFK